MARLKASKTKQDKDFLTLNPTSVVQLQLPLSATAELVQPSNQTTLVDKSPICNHSTQMPKSSKISAVESTLKQKDCKPYWTDLCEEISSRLLLPVVTDSQGLDSSLLSTWSSKTVDESWFSTTLYIAQSQNLSRIFSPSSTSSLVGCTDSGSTVKKSRKIRICLTTEHRQIVKQWFGVSRFVYNTTVKLLQDSSIKANWKAIKTDILNGLPEWSKSVPYQIIAGGRGQGAPEHRSRGKP